MSGLIQNFSRGVPYLFHHGANHAGAFVQAVFARRIGSIQLRHGNGGQGSVDESDDTPERYGARRAIQGVPTATSGSGMENSGAF